MLWGIGNVGEVDVGDADIGPGGQKASWLRRTFFEEKKVGIRQNTINTCRPVYVLCTKYVQLPRITVIPHPYSR